MDKKLEQLRQFLKDKGLTQAKIAEVLDVDRGYINQLLTGRKAFGKKVAEQWSDQFGLSKSWLLTGEGDMEKEATKSVDTASPCFDLVSIQGGMAMGNGTEQLTKDMSIGMMSVPGVPVGSSIPYIKVRGTSMVNRKDPAHSIPEGAWIGITPSKSSAIHWGEVYAIMTTDGPVVKKVMPSEQEGCIKCVSFNEEDGFLPYDQPTNEIIQPLYQVVAVITAKPW